MVLKGSAYQISNKMIRNSKFAFSRIMLLFRRIQSRIELINIFLGEPEIDDKLLKSKISLLSNLLDVKRKLKLELKELSLDSGKGKDQLSEILSKSRQRR